MLKLIAAVLIAATVATPSLARPRDSGAVQLQKLLAGRVAGKPTSCIYLGTASSSQVIEGKAIVYRVGGTLYVNEPRSGASDLGHDDILVTRTFGSQLCSIDVVRLVDRTAGFERGFVLLGEFVPYTKSKFAN